MEQHIRRLAISLWLLFSTFCYGANVPYTAFNLNQFATNNQSISGKVGILLTNVVVRAEYSTNVPLAVRDSSGNPLLVFTNGFAGIGMEEPWHHFQVTASGILVGWSNSATTSPIRHWFYANRATANASLSELQFKWNTQEVARISIKSGPNTMDKNDGEIALLTATAGTLTEGFRLKTNGNITIPFTVLAGSLTVTSSMANLGTLTNSGVATFAAPSSFYDTVAIYASPLVFTDSGFVNTATIQPASTINTNVTLQLPTNAIVGVLFTTDDGGVQQIQALSPGSAGQVVTSTGTSIAFSNAAAGGLGAYISFGPGVLTTPVDATTYYFGAFPTYTPDGNQGRQRLTMDRAGTIKAVTIDSYASTAGSNEDWTFQIKINNGAPTAIATVAAATNIRLWQNTGLSIAVVATDYIEIFCTTPTWGTDPSSFRMAGRIYLE